MRIPQRHAAFAALAAASLVLAACGDDTEEPAAEEPTATASAEPTASESEPATATASETAVEEPTHRGPGVEAICLCSLPGADHGIAMLGRGAVLLPELDQPVGCGAEAAR